MSEYQLGLAIVKLSEGPVWEIARKEWRLLDVDMSEDEHTCLCGHFPIKELCTIENKLNRKTATVGNCCVKKFLGLPSDKIFSAVKRIRTDAEKSLNKETIEFAFERGWLSQWEFDFYNDIHRKRVLSPKQLSVKLRINGKVLARARKS